MDILLEQRAIQNPALGALLISRVCKEYSKGGPPTQGLSLPKVLLVLPMLFHRQTVAAIKGMQRQSGLFKALADNPYIKIGLQARFQSLTDSTWTAILLAGQSKLILVDRTTPWPSLFPTSQAAKGLNELKPTHDDGRDMLKAAARLGWWFRAFRDAELYSLLGLGVSR